MSVRDEGRQASEDWWSTDIIEMSPGKIGIRGYPIQALIGEIGFVEMIWLMLRGDLPTKGQANLLGAALMAAVDHGPQAPSIAIARIAATCGVGINNAMASATNTLGDAHGGAGEQCVALYAAIAARMDAGDCIEKATQAELEALHERGVRYVPGFGHRFHPVDPRSAPLLEIVEAAAREDIVSDRFVSIGREVEAAIARKKGSLIPMNVDGATAVVYGALGFPAPLCRGLFVLSRSVGIMAHAWEQMQRPERNKGPIPRQFLWTYTGQPERFPRAGEPE